MTSRTGRNVRANQVKVARSDLGTTGETPCCCVLAVDRHSSFNIEQ